MKEYIVFTNNEHYNDLGIVRTLGESGLEPILVAVKGHVKFVGKSKYVKKTHYVNSAEEGLALIVSEYSSAKEKSFIIAGNDVIVSTLDKHYNELKEFFYFYNAGENDRINYFMEKDRMIEIVKKHGINVAKTWKVKVGDIPNNIIYPVLTKALNSTGQEWKNIVFICKDKNELNSAFKKIKSQYILLQQYIEKIDEISFDGFSIEQGKQTIILTEANQEYCIPDKYSPYWNIKNNTDLETTEKIKNVIQEMGFEGIFEFEFIVDKNGNKWFLEINFRNTALGYSTTTVGMPQVILWCHSMETGEIPKDCIKIIPSNTKAMAECFDYDARVKTGLISKKEWLKQYKDAKCKLYKGHDDFLPFFLFMWHKLTKMK